MANVTVEHGLLCFHAPLHLNYRKFYKYLTVGDYSKLYYYIPL